MQVSEGYAAIHGLPEGTTEKRAASGSAACIQRILREEAAPEQAFRERRGEYNVEYRIVRHGEVRWVETR